MRTKIGVGKGEHYVYAAYGVNKELLYIGKGKGTRWKHCSSGISSSKALNRYYFSNGEDGSISTAILFRFPTNAKALHKEKELIDMYQPPFNLDGIGSPKMVLMKEVGEYYRGLEKYLTDLDRDLGRKKYINWLNKLKHFVKILGYARLIEGMPVSKDSLNKYNDTKLLGVYRAVISHSTAPDIIINIFEIGRINKEVYFIKLNKEISYLQ